MAAVSSRVKANSVEAPSAAVNGTVEPELRDSYCEKHKRKSVETYCFQCKVNACVLCVRYEHQEHDCLEISKAAEMLLTQIDVDVKRVDTRVDAVRREEQQTEKERDSFLGQLETAAKAIRQKGEAIKRLVDRQVNELLQEVQSMRSHATKEAETRAERLRVALVTMENFNAYSLAMKSKGKPSDITRAANELHVRADELLQTSVTPGDFRPPYVEFRPAEHGNGLVGDLRAKKMAEIRLLHTLPDGEDIWGVAQLGDELYVLRYKGVEQIEVYDSNNFSLKRRLTVPDLRSTTDLASCEQNRCLYVADEYAKRVHRLDPRGDATRWSVYARPFSLSVTDAFTVLVTCSDVAVLKEFSTDGNLIRQVELQSNVIHQHHSVQLANGQFVVCYGDCTDPVNGVDLVDVDGRTLLTYGGQRGSTAGQLDCPTHLAVDGDQFVFVADVFNQRVLLLNPELKHVRDVVSCGNGLKREPIRIFFDKRRRRLYVAENDRIYGRLTAGRLTVFSL